MPLPPPKSAGSAAIRGNRADAASSDATPTAAAREDDDDNNDDDDAEAAIANIAKTATAVGVLFQIGGDRISIYSSSFTSLFVTFYTKKGWFIHHKPGGPPYTGPDQLGS